MGKVLGAAAKIAVGSLIFAGLPLAGWGLSDASGFAASPARLAYLALAVLLQLLVGVFLPSVGRRRGRGSRTVRRQRFAVILLQVLSLAIVLGAPWGDRRDRGALPDSAALRIPGLVLFAAGFWLMNRAEASLGRQFSIQVELQEDHRLVTEGLYRRLRHPRYAGILLFNAGMALVFRSWAALLLVAGMAAVVIWRIRDEESLLRRAFGGEWEEYSRRSWRLVPFVY